MYAKRIQQKKFSWGGVALLTPFPAHGTVSIVGSFIGGSRLAGGEELAKIHAEMLLEGTRKHPKKELQILLDSIGASLSFSAGSERLYFTAKVRALHVHALLALISEIIREPAFPTRELSLLKKREIANLAMEAQDTAAQARTALARMLYKPGHPNHEETLEESRAALDGLTRAALASFHARTLDGGSLIISIAGDVNKDTLRIIDRYFKIVPRQNIAMPPHEKAASAKGRRAAIRVEHKANIDYMAGITVGIGKDDADYPALLLGIQILGVPGFSGRLMQTVREREGLTYFVYSYFAGTQGKTDGHILVWSTFAPSLFTQGRAAIQREVRTLLRRGATAREVQKHKDRFEGNYRTRLSNSAAFAQAAHDIVEEGRPLSYLDAFPARIRKLTVRDINRVLKKYLIPTNMSEAAAGPVDLRTLSLTK